MSLDQQLLEILACPAEDHAPLTYDIDAQTLTCTSCARVFPVRDGLPVLLLDEAEQGDAEQGEQDDAEQPAAGA